MIVPRDFDEAGQHGGAGGRSSANGSREPKPSDEHQASNATDSRPSGTDLLDSKDRARGRVSYVDDVRLPDLLHAKFLRSPYAHARIVSIDTSAAAAISGVKAIITGKDTPRRYGVLPVGHDETALATDKVRYLGQEVAAVAATSPRVATAAIRAIRVEYEELPAYFTICEAREANEHWIHADRPRNIEKEYHHVFGDPDAAFRSAVVIVEDEFKHPRVTHAALEPHGTVAVHEPGERYTLWTSTQTPRHVQQGVARALEVEESAVRVIPCAVGGAFGGKSETFPADVAAAILAQRSGRPVRFSLSREEVFLLHRGRPESEIRMRVGLTREGKIAAVACESHQDGGAFCSYGVVTILYSGALLCALYDVQHMRFDGYRILTNKPACGPMRGHGTIGARHAFEVLLDRAAAALGLDPIDVRRRNFLQENSRTVNDLRVTSYGFPECVEKVEAASKWKEKHGRLPSGRGVGFGASHYVSGASNSIIRGTFPHSTVSLQTERSGELTLLTGASEIGQGSDTVLAIIVSSVLGLEPSDIRVVSGDTALTPNDLGSYSSRVTFMTGNAALEAAEKLRDKIRARVARRVGVAATQLVLRDRRVCVEDDPQRGMGFVDSLKLLVEEENSLTTTGSYRPPPAAQGGKFPGAGVGPGVSYSYSAQVVEIEVNRETGEIKVLQVWAAHDCGKALNEVAVRGQVEGSIWMGVGQALCEEQRFSRQGLLFNPGLLEYKVPTTLDTPPIDVFLVESADPEGPFGAKEAGEGSLGAVLPALTNAVYDAVGVWIPDLPLTPERVLAAIRRKESGEAVAAETDSEATSILSDAIKTVN